MAPDATQMQRMIRPNQLTRSYLQRLPYLLPLAVVIEVTGLTKHGVRAAVTAGSLRTWSTGTSRKSKYFRDDVLALIGLGPNIQIRPHRPDSASSTCRCSTTTGQG